MLPRLEISYEIIAAATNVAVRLDLAVQIQNPFTKPNIYWRYFNYLKKIFKVNISKNEKY